uniref:Uncharacterized protein n=1 Tax=Arundo donax TaxID=35708 RepID=A0A0A8ZSF7_ARUDO
MVSCFVLPAYLYPMAAVVHNNQPCKDIEHVARPGSRCSKHGNN